MRHSHIYAALTATGHSATKAAEILLDAQRGNSWARAWIGTITRIHRGQV